MTNILNAAMAEAFAFRDGLNLVERIGCINIIVESDNAELIETCSGGSEIWSPHSSIMADCFIIAGGLGNISFKHCPRETNKVAHNLARKCYDSDVIFIWEGDPPLSVAQDALNDIYVLSG